jgi:hypothetical protein
MKIPVSTIEKPLTVIDYIAALQQCVTTRMVRGFAQEVPLHIRQDERFAKAVAQRLAAIKERRG